LRLKLASLPADLTDSGRLFHTTHTHCCTDLAQCR